MSRSFCLPANQLWSLAKSSNGMLLYIISIINFILIFRKPLKDILFKGKRVLVYNKHISDDPKTIPFGDIWTPLMQNLGATIVGNALDEPFSKESESLPATLEQKLNYCDKGFLFVNNLITF